MYTSIVFNLKYAKKNRVVSKYSKMSQNISKILLSISDRQQETLIDIYQGLSLTFCYIWKYFRFSI